MMVDVSDAKEANDGQMQCLRELLVPIVGSEYAFRTLRVWPHLIQATFKHRTTICPNINRPHRHNGMKMRCVRSHRCLIVSCFNETTCLNKFTKVPLTVDQLLTLFPITLDHTEDQQKKKQDESDEAAEESDDDDDDDSHSENSDEVPSDHDVDIDDFLAVDECDRFPSRSLCCC